MEDLDSEEEEVSAMEEEEVMHQSSVTIVGHLTTIREIVPIFNACTTW